MIDWEVAGVARCYGTCRDSPLPIARCGPCVPGGPPHGAGEAVGRDEFEKARLHPPPRDG
jgi:hypothetical protein